MDFFARWFDQAMRFQREYAQSLIARFEFVAYPGGARFVEREFVRLRGLNVALARESRVVLTGSLGAGRTSALANLTLKYAREMLDDPSRPRVPIFVSGRRLAREALHISNLPRGLDLDESLAARCPRDFFAKANAAGRIVLLIDDGDGTPSSALEALVKEFANARIIASASKALTGFAEFALPGFRDEDIESFAAKRFGQRAVDFVTAAKANGVPRALTSNPFTLTLLDLVWRASSPATKPTTDLHETYGIKPLPTRRTELFDAFANGVIGNDNETARMLEGVALAMQRSHPAPGESISKSKGFLRAGKNQTAEFVHDLWRDYFAARALRHAPDLAPLAEHLGDPRWRETILFYAGLGDASELVETFVARGDLGFAGFALAHAKQARPDLNESVTKELVARAWSGDEYAVSALAEMRSESAVDGFAAKLKDPDASVRERAVKILSQFQMDRSIEYLLTQLRDISPAVRDRVVAVLGHSLSSRVVEPLLVSLRGDSRFGLIDTRMRIAAGKALGEVGSDKAVPALIVDLQIGEPEVRAVAAESLKRIASQLMIKPLKGVALTGDELARKFASEVLASMNGSTS